MAKSCTSSFRKKTGSASWTGKNTGQHGGGIPILSPEEAGQYFPDACVLVTPGDKGVCGEIGRYLMDQIGMEGEDIFLFGEAWKDHNHDYFEDFMPHSENECFVDAGVYNGDTTLEFVAWARNHYRRVYMFEPSGDYYERYYRNISHLDNVMWIKKGLWSREDTLEFYERPDHDISTHQNLSGIGKQYRYAEGGWVRIPVTSLDACIPPEERITFIKMDIEGSEYEALKGCERIIREQHPKLAICLYHKEEDIYEIPKLILQFYSEYRFFVRHQSLDTLDTVLYAV